jgi:hypothetical protein
MGMTSRDRHIAVGDLAEAGLGLLPKSFSGEMRWASDLALAALLMRRIAMLQQDVQSVTVSEPTGSLIFRLEGPLSALRYRLRMLS